MCQLGASHEGLFRGVKRQANGGATTGRMTDSCGRTGDVEAGAIEGGHNVCFVLTDASRKVAEEVEHPNDLSDDRLQKSEGMIETRGK